MDRRANTVASTGTGETNAAAQPPADGKLILLVEDHELMRTATKAMLSRAFPECTVLAAESGARAVYLTAAHRPNVVLMDLHLPDMDGVATTHVIHDGHPAVPVILWSSDDGPQARRYAGSANARQFVSKNQPFERVVEVVRQALQPG